MRLTALAIAASLAVAPLTTVIGVQAAQAAPLAKSAVTTEASGVTQIQFRHGARGYWPGRGWGWSGPRYGGAAVVGGVLIGSAIVAAAIAERRAEASALRACARDYRAFDYESGTYIDSNGDVRVCPYLY